MSAPARLARAFLLCALLLATAADALDPGAVAVVSVEAAGSEADATLSFRVTAKNASASVNAVVTHEDPLVGTVIDRVVPLDLAANATLQVNLEDTKPGIEHNVTILLANVTLPTLSPETLLPNASRLPLLPVVTQLVEPIQRAARPDETHVLHGYNVTAEFSASPPDSLRVQASGLVVATSSVSWVDEEEQLRSAVLVHVSRDGGHTFKTTLNFTGDEDGSPTRTTVAAGAAGPITMFYNAMRGDLRSSQQVGGTRWIRVDPAEGRILARGTLRADAHYLGHAEATALPDGTVLFAARDAEQPGVYPPQIGLDVWRLLPDGTASVAASFPAPERFDTPHFVHVDASGGHVALLWAEAPPIHDPYAGGSPASITVTLRSARSLDGGLTFGEASTIPSFTPPETPLYPWGMRLDPLGTIHFVAEAWSPPWSQDTSDGVFERRNVTSFYGRVPLAGDASVIALNGPGGLLPGGLRALQPAIGVSGARVWIFWSDEVELDPIHSQRSSYGIESVDGGRTFGAPYHAVTEGRAPLAPVDDLDVFPDGRPVLLSRYLFPDNRWLLSVVPLFDPIPPEDAGLTIIDVVSPGDSPRVPPVPTVVTPLPPSPRTTVDPPPPPQPPATAVVVPMAAAGGVVVAAGALALTGVGQYVVGLAVAALYSRISNADVLRHDVRAGVHAHVARHPGIRYEALRRDLGLVNGVMAFHVRVLEREGYVVRRVEGTRCRLYATGATVPPGGAGAPEARARVLALLGEAGTLRAADAASRLDMSRQLARYHLRALEREGAAQRVGSGRNAAYVTPPPTRPPPGRR